ncbi:MAG: hypothetical protein IJJ13_06445 [Lachnospiraceae bacterium]|nr:hypothetical protein [Lachnospiraceae bacterium]
MDIKAKIEEIVKKIKDDPGFMKTFQDNPEKAIESAAGIDIPDGMLDQVVNGVKAKLTADKVGGAVDSLKKMFGQ